MDWATIIFAIVVVCQAGALFVGWRAMKWYFAKTAAPPAFTNIFFTIYPIASVVLVLVLGVAVWTALHSA